MFKSLFKSLSLRAPRSNSLADDFALNNHTPNARDREADFLRSIFGTLDASALRGTIAKCVWVTPYGVPRPHEFLFRRAANAAAIPEGWPRLKPRRSVLCKGGADFPHFVAVRVLAVAAVGGGFVELVARDLVERALHAARHEWPFDARFCRVHESESGTSRCDGRSDKCRLLRKLRTKRAAVAPRLLFALWRATSRITVSSA